MKFSKNSVRYYSWKFYSNSFPGKISRFPQNLLDKYFGKYIYPEIISRENLRNFSPENSFPSKFLGIFQECLLEFLTNFPEFSEKFHYPEFIPGNYFLRTRPDNFSGKFKNPEFILLENFLILSRINSENLVNIHRILSRKIHSQVNSLESLFYFIIPNSFQENFLELIHGKFLKLFSENSAR